LTCGDAETLAIAALTLELPAFQWVKPIVVIRRYAVWQRSHESQDIGFVRESNYRLQPVGFPTSLEAQSQVEWQGKRYAIEGEHRRYNDSRRTAHVDYIIERR
jgi:hypothetical protein